KAGTEYIVNLKDHDQLASSPINVSAGLPAAFGGSLIGAQLAFLGTFDEDAVPNRNLMFSNPAGVDPLPSGVTPSFTAFVSFFLNTLPSITTRGGTTPAPILVTDANSFTLK